MKYSKKLKSIFVMSSSLVLSACSVFGVNTVEQAKYKTVFQEGKFSVRQYAPTMVAKVFVANNDYRQASNQAFRVLFRYISGDNQSRQKIAMTAPVLVKDESEKIAMTTPVMTQKIGKSGWEMSFVLPSKFNSSNTPKPDNAKITIAQLSSVKYAVYQFSGRLTRSSRESSRLKLEAWMKKNKYKLVGEVKYAQYNSPWTLPFARRNEVLVEISAK